MTPEERAALRSAWLQGVEEEIERRRQATIEAAGGDPRQQLLLELAEIGARLREAPDYRPPAPEEDAEAKAWLDAWFAAYTRAG